MIFSQHKTNLRKNFFLPSLSFQRKIKVEEKMERKESSLVHRVLLVSFCYLHALISHFRPIVAVSIRCEYHGRSFCDAFFLYYCDCQASTFPFSSSSPLIPDLIPSFKSHRYQENNPLPSRLSFNACRSRNDEHSHSWLHLDIIYDSIAVSFYQHVPIFNFPLHRKLFMKLLRSDYILWHFLIYDCLSYFFFFNVKRLYLFYRLLLILRKWY